MIGFYVLLVLSIIIFILLNIFFYNLSLFSLNFLIIIILEIILAWICFGPQLVLYYFLKLKKTLDSYRYLYDEYNRIKRLATELEFQNILDRKEFEEKLSEKDSSLAYEIIEGQKKVIEGLTNIRDKLKKENLDLKEKTKKYEELKGIIKKMQERIDKLENSNKGLKELNEQLVLRNNDLKNQLNNKK